MTIYLVIFVALSFSALFERKKEYNIESKAGHIIINSWNVKVFLFAVVIVVMAGIRWEIGTDWDSFLSDFQFMKVSSWSAVNSSIYGLTYGKGYVLMTYLFAKYIGDYSLYLTFQAVVIVSCVYPVIYEHSKYPAMSFLGLFCYTFGYAFAVPRSGIAMAICYLAYDAFSEKKYAKTGVLILIATMFHNTAIIFALIFFLGRIKLTVPQVTAIGLISVALSFFARPILLRIASLPFMPLSYSMRISIYFMEDVDFGGVGGLVRIITRGFVVVLVFMYLWKRRDEEKINLLVNMYLLATAIYIFASNISEVFMRMAYNFEDVSQFIIFSECLASTKNKDNNVILRIVMIVFFAAKMFARLIGNELFVPFRTIFGM
ncbi:MAG: EpsG family protein [Lachnospiraceae bacterium]|nr:EpsG family protein [Lachnospiraceae bacterium]